MRVPVALVDAFKDGFEPVLTDFMLQQRLLPEGETLESKRYLSRSIAPHVKALSNLFNRMEGSQTDGIDTEAYWTEGGSAKNRRLAYFLSFMPCNLFRVAAVWSELQRLGFKWPFPADGEFRGLEWGAGLASGACGVIAGEKHAPLGLPARGNFALIEQSKAALQMGKAWFEHFSGSGYDARPFHRRVELGRRWLPEAAPRFHLFVSSYFLNESELPPEVIASNLIDTCEHHLEDEGLVILVEPALRLQSRKLLQIRKALIAHPKVISGAVPLQVLLPCLGHQACGALTKEDDWCHEEVNWWRPPYLRELDALAGLDRKSLPFSYLVLQKTRKSREEILPRLQGPSGERHRLVSPTHSLGKKTWEFFMCGEAGKRRARLSRKAISGGNDEPDRGSILQRATLHGEASLTQIDSAEVLD
jgi:hypothetical protein